MSANKVKRLQVDNEKLWAMIKEDENKLIEIDELARVGLERWWTRGLAQKILKVIEEEF